MQPRRTRDGKPFHRSFHSEGLRIPGRFSAWIMLAAALAVTLPRAATAQVLYGSLVGNVTDSSGSAIVGASVDATNTQTGVARLATTNGSGAYQMTDLAPGTYRVSIEAATFAKTVSNGVAVRANSVLRLDAQLHPATLGQTVTVTGAPPELQTDSAAVTSNLESAQLENIVAGPGAGMRNFQSIYQILPGFTPPTRDHSEAGNPGDTLFTNVNGVSGSNNNTRIDGVSDIYAWLPEIAAYAPSTEAIASVNVVTNSFDAEQGFASGSVVNVTTKSGTNSFHGAAWEYNTISALEAKPYFLPANKANPKYILNQFGANFGGPIRKNKAFFFANWERVRRSQAVSGFQTIPTQAMLGGDFSAISTRIYDPTTGNADGSGRTQFQNNTIPAGRISYAASQMIKLMPTPNVTTSGLSNNYFVATDAQYTRDNIDSRVDWVPSSKSTIFGRYGIQKANLFDPQALGKAGGNTLDGGQPGNAPSIIQSVGIGGTYAFLPDLLLDANVGFLRQGMSAQNTDIGTNYGLDYLKIPGTNGTSRLTGGFPRFTMSSLSSIGNPSNSNPFQFRDNTYTSAVNVSWNKGSHSMRFGGEFQHYALNHFQPQNTVGPRGGFSFSGGVTALKGGASPNGFNSWADFLLGLPQTIQKDTQFLNPAAIRENVWAFYARDQWRISSRLTFNYGLRYEVYPLAKTDHTGLYIFNPADGNIYIGGVNGVPRNSGVDVGHGILGPRVGLAFRVDSKTVLRAGYGLSANPDSYRNVLTSYPSVISLTLQGNTTYIPAGSLTTGIPSVTPPNISSGKINLAQQGTPHGTLGATTLPLKYRRGYYESYNAAVERELPGVTVQATYVGNLIIREVPGLNINAAPPGGGVAGRPLNQSLGISASITSEIPIGTGHYNALQIQTKHRFANGGSVGANYTWSRSMNDYGDQSDGSSSLFVAYLPDYYRNRGVSGFDRTHNFELFGNYKLPIGAGGTWMRGGVAGYLLEGWGLAGSLSRASGTPFTVTASSASLNAPGSSQFADQLVSKVKILGGHDSTHPYFDPADFADPAVAIKAAGGQARFGTASRNSVRGPGLFNLSTSLSRTFSITERFKMLFRADAFNLTNTPSFSNPGANVSSVTQTSLNGFGIISGTSNNNRQLTLSAKVSF